MSGVAIEDAFRSIIRAEMEPLRDEIRRLHEQLSTADEFLTKQQAAKMVNCSVKTINRWAAAGLKIYGHGAVKRVRKRELVEFMEHEEEIDVRSDALQIVGES